MHLIHPPAGVVGGDILDISIHLDRASRAQILTPGATLIYRSAGPAAQLATVCSLEQGASLEYLPHETIHFNGARSRARTRIDLAADARLIWRETHCFGRTAASERFDEGMMRWRTDVCRNGAPFWSECTRIEAPKWTEASAGMRSHAYTGTLLAAPVDPAICEKLRSEVCDDNTAVTCIEDLLVARYLGDDGQLWRATSEALWRVLRPAVMGHCATRPRIWAT